MIQGKIGMAGNLGIKKIERQKAPISWKLKNWSRSNFVFGLVSHKLANLFTNLTGIPCMLGKLDATIIKKDGTVIDYGTLGYMVVTTAFVNFVVDQLQTETSVFGDFKYHDSGVGVTAEAVGDTDIETTDGESRATGTQTEGASANIYRSVGTISYTTTKAITEHGLFNATTGVTLMDRTVFSAINVVNGDSIQFTYELTLTAGS